MVQEKKSNRNVQREDVEISDHRSSFTNKLYCRMRISAKKLELKSKNEKLLAFYHFFQVKNPF